MNRVYILAFLIALLASFLLTPYVKKLAFKIGALDRPNKRKVHHKVMPRLGGLAIYCGFLLSVLCTMHISRDVLGLLLGGTVIMIVGVIDDKYQLPAKVKLLGQILAACVLVLFDIKIEWLNNPWGGYFYLEYFSIPLTIFWVISFTNVVNLIDGLDGLAAGVSAIASITVILVAVQQGVFPVAILTAALAGGIIGFIRYNFNPASIFMGDTGSMFIGGATVGMAMLLRQPFLLILIAFTMIMSSVSVIVQRTYFKLTHGKRIFKMSPIHHHFELSGMTEPQIVTMYTLVTGLLSIIAVLSVHVIP